MGKVLSLLAAGWLAIAACLVPQQNHFAGAQAVPPAISCSGQTISSPTQGHYTGSWHSDGDYHFAVYNTDLDLKITIDGSLDLTVSPNGQVSGTASGKVDAPITDYGRHDISSGIGSISGTVTGVFSGTGSLLVLSHPVIDMHWGTFGGGHAVERFITMPDYQFPASGVDCVSGQGTITEKNFPVQNIVPDGTNLPVVQAPGVGAATGTWQTSSDEASHFRDLSQQVDSFIAQANATLNQTAPLNAAGVDRSVIQPLKSLEAAIRQNPTIARCLLERLGAWEVSLVPTLFSRVQSLAGSGDLATLRQAADLLRSARALNADCALQDNGASAAITGRQKALFDEAISRRDWVQAVLIMREILLLLGAQGRPPLQAWIGADLHALLLKTGDQQGLLTLARVAYAAGDDADTGAAYRLLSTHAHGYRVGGTVRIGESAGRAVGAAPSGGPYARGTYPGRSYKQSHTVGLQFRTDRKAKPHKKRKKHTTKPAVPTATPTPAPTATPVARTLQQVLYDGVTQIAGRVSGSPPVFSWQPVPGAQRYLVIVVSAQQPALLWSWSGGGTSATYGDTAIEGAAGTGEDWPLSLTSADYSWSVIALDNRGQVVGGTFRQPAL